MLARAEWGAKHVCPECASRYYDLKQTTYVCPSCGAEPAARKLPSGGRRGRGFGNRTPFGQRRAVAAEAPLIDEATPAKADEEEADEEETDEDEADEEENSDDEESDEAPERA